MLFNADIVRFHFTTIFSKDSRYLANDAKAIWKTKGLVELKSGKMQMRAQWWEKTRGHKSLSRLQWSEGPERDWRPVEE